MTGKGSNGLLVHENLKHQQSKRVIDRKAELALTKCTAMPTKRQWHDRDEAIREAEARSEAAKMAIYAYKCPACEFYHLTRKFGPDIVTREKVAAEVDTRWEAMPLVLGDKTTRMRALSGWLAEQESPTTADIIAEFNWHSTTVATYMAELGWTCSKGRHAKWTRVELAEAEAKPEEAPAAVITPLAVAKVKVSAQTELEASIARHPASQMNPWASFQMDRVRHIPLGDILDVLDAAGVELSIRTREKR